MEYRALLAVFLSIIILFAYQYFMPSPQPPAKTLVQSANVTQGEKITKNLIEEDVSEQKLSPVSEGEQITNELNNQPESVKTRDIVIESDLYKVIISEKGALLKEFLLKKYKTKIEDDDSYVDLIKLFNAGKKPFSLTINDASGKKLDLSSLYFVADKENLVLDNKNPKGTITLTARLDDGKKILKQIQFSNEKYLIETKYLFQDFGASAFTLSLFANPEKKNTYIFEGASYYSNGQYEELDVKEGKAITYNQKVDWASFGDNYFMMAMLPFSTGPDWKVEFEKKGKESPVGVKLGGSMNNPLNELNFGFFIGPKDLEQLKKGGNNLDEAINFGWFHIFAKPLFYALRIFNDFLHNYGLSIILLTVLIKLVFWPLSHQSSQSMKTLQKIQPKLKKIQEKYKDDKERLNKEIMQLYKTYKVNPLGGCLPMLLQIPVFFALYKVLLQSIELRHAPFFLWINDLSAPDRLMIGDLIIPFIGGIPVLTILMGISMWFQQKMTPTTMDPTQAKIMQFLPVIFTFMFLSFPSGLVLYWLVNNVLSIVQQYYINKYTS